MNPMKTTSPTNFYSNNWSNICKKQGMLNMIESMANFLLPPNNFIFGNKNRPVLISFLVTKIGPLSFFFLKKKGLLQ
jgi:hypothetical protein